MLRQEPTALTRIADTLHQIQREARVSALIAQATPCNASSLTPLAGDEIHAQSRAMIAQARQEVCMQFYKFFGTSVGGTEIINGLRLLHARATLERPRAPVMVNVVLNARGSLAQALYKKNNPTGLEELAAELNNPFFQIRVAYHPTAAFGTFHTKMIVTDGEIAMLRGGDPATTPAHQFETATLSTGSNVRCIRADFQESWNRLKSADQARLADLPEVKHGPEEKKAEVPCVFISKKENGTPIGTVKYRGCESPYKIALLEAIASATHSIKIMSPNLNDRDICRALAEACNRGVDVRIVMGKHHNDAAEAHWGGTNFDSMAAFVSQVDASHQQYINIRWATNPDTGEIVQHGGHHTVHGKFACIDSSLVFVGSTPLDKQGIYHSREADLIFEDPAQADIFTRRMFQEKYRLGKDYFMDCVDELVRTIQIQIDRLAKTQGPDAITCRRKASMLRNELREVLSRIDHPDVENHNKPKILLRVMLPILDLHTSPEESRSRTASYKAVREIAKKYGIYQLVRTGLVPRESKEAARPVHSASVVSAPPSGQTVPRIPIATPTPILASSIQTSLGISRSALAENVAPPTAEVKTSVTTSNQDDPLAAEVDRLAAESRARRDQSAPSGGDAPTDPVGRDENVLPRVVHRPRRV